LITPINRRKMNSRSCLMSKKRRLLMPMAKSLPPKLRSMLLDNHHPLRIKSIKISMT